MGYGPFGEGDASKTILLLQGFVGIIAVTMLALSADVAHRQRIEQRLTRYKTTSLQTADHWMLTDVHGMVLEVNPSFESVTGYGAEEVVGRKANILRSGEHDQGFYERMWTTIMSGQTYRGVVINRKKDGELFYEMKTITPIRSAKGEVTHFLSLGKDITELKLVEEQLRRTAKSLEQSNEQLRGSEAALNRHATILESVFDSMSEGVVVADDEGRFVMFNQTAQDMVGIGATDASPGDWTVRYGVYLPDKVTPYPPEELPLVKAIQGINTENAETFIRNPNKPQGVWLRVNGMPLRDDAGDIIGGVIIFDDITAAKRVEEAEKELQANREEFEIAGKIQQQLFPSATFRFDGLDISGATFPAVATAGDYYDYMTMSDGRLAVVVGDVSGHGLGPALLMASVRAYLHALLQSGMQVGDVLRLLNRLIKDDTGAEDFVTMILAHIDPRTRVLEYSNAGHTTCYVLNRENNVKALLESTGPALGVMDGAKYPHGASLALEPEDLVLLVTDGVLEAECPHNGFFGHRRALDVVRTHHERSAAQIVKALHEELTTHSAGTAQDDITAVVIKVRGSSLDGHSGL